MELRVYSAGLGCMELRVYNVLDCFELGLNWDMLCCTGMDLLWQTFGKRPTISLCFIILKLLAYKKYLYSIALPGVEFSKRKRVYETFYIND